MAAAELTIITAADAAYYRCLLQFLASAKRLRLTTKYRWIVYDLGLDESQAKALRQRHPWVGLRKFEFANYPPHFALSYRSYAWKPAIIHELLEETQAFILFLDSATILCAPPDEVFAELRGSGVYVLRGQTAVGQHCDPRTIRQLQIGLELLDEPEFAAGVIGLDGSRAEIRYLANRWFQWALDPSIISPREPKFDQHKPEQALLTFLLLERQSQGLPIPQYREIDISSTNPVRWMSSRNKVKPWVPRQFDLLVRAWYRTYKTVDRWWLRMALEDRLGGVRRWFHEDYGVYVGRRGQSGAKRISAPFATYFADPFVFEYLGILYLLVEQFRYAHAKGCLLVLQMNHRLEPVSKVVLSTGPGHASFPFIFEEDGEIYLIPETSDRLSIDLFTFEDFPNGFKRVARLMYGIDAADTIFFRFNGLYWLVSAIRIADEKNRVLALYYSEDWRTSRWTEHPVNRSRLYANRNHSYGRCAGPIVFDGKSLLRPIHASENYYGERVEWRRIVRLNTSEFLEERCEAPSDFGGFSPELHHISSSPTFWTYDVREVTGIAGRLSRLMWGPSDTSVEHACLRQAK